MNRDTRIGIDLGGTKIEGVVVTGLGEDLKVLTRKRIPTEAEKGYDHILGGIEYLVDSLVRELDLKAGTRIGIGMPGSVTKEGRIKNSNTVCLNGTYFRQELTERLERPVSYANDADLFALSEAVLGAGRGYDLVFGVIMGTGVGGGIVYKRELRNGPQSTSGEWGHMTLRTGGDPLCYCGKRGCVETYLAGPWLEKHYTEISNETVSLSEVVDRYRGGEKNAVDVVSTWLDNYGKSLANAINMLDPDVVVLGGGVSNVDFLYSEGRKQVERYVFSESLETPIVKNKLGDSSGVLGAALIA